MEGARGAPSYFSTKMRLEGPKQIFLETGPPPLSQGLDDQAPPSPPPSYLKAGSATDNNNQSLLRNKEILSLRRSFHSAAGN